MTNTAVARTGRHMTHLVTLDGQGAPVALACQPSRALPASTILVVDQDAAPLVCNRCSGATRTGRSLGR